MKDKKIIINMILAYSIILILLIWGIISLFIAFKDFYQKDNLCKENLGEEGIASLGGSKEGYVKCCIPVYENNLEVDEYCEAIKM